MPEPPPPAPPPRRALGLLAWLWRPLLVLVVAGGLGLWMWGLPERERPERERPAEATPEAPAEAEPPPAPRAWRPREVRAPAPGCTPQAERRCADGDAWWVDGCGVVYAKAQECGVGLCRGGECEPAPPPGCGGIPPLGRCDGDVAQGCEAGYPFEV
ncbi:MAG: hypothetical protein KDK70_23510, partial [Myxococcales bacterium]|nr:hypothetical protein [Myxococcales bacterium]